MYFESKDGTGGREHTVEEFRSNYEAMLTDSSVPIGLPVERYDSDFDYYAAVYSKGAVFIDELRTRMGDEAFFAFLQTYYSQNRLRLCHRSAATEDRRDDLRVRSGAVVQRVGVWARWPAGPLSGRAWRGTCRWPYGSEFAEHPESGSVNRKLTGKQRAAPLTGM